MGRRYKIERNLKLKKELLKQKREKEEKEFRKLIDSMEPDKSYYFEMNGKKYGALTGQQWKELYLKNYGTKANN